MPRFYITPENISQDKVIIFGPQAHHIINVLRLRTGDEISLFDGSGYEYRCQIIRLKPCKLIAKVQARLCPAVESPVNIVLGQAIIKLDKLELTIQKATELGVSQIVPLRCARSRRITPDVLAQKLGRWQRIATCAAQQCGRVRFPKIRGLLDLGQFCANFEAADLKLIFWEQKGRGLKEVFNRITLPRQVVLLVGAEGGFNVDDGQLAQEHGFIPAGLGPRILRAETAAIAALSLVQYELGDMG